MKIALDAMGGDFGPPNLVGGAVQARLEYPQLHNPFTAGDTPHLDAALTKNNSNEPPIHSRTTHLRLFVRMCSVNASAPRSSPRRAGARV